MTCREKLKIEHPNFVGITLLGGCLGCPSSYGYLDNPEDCNCYNEDDCCVKCWDREIPEQDLSNVECPTKEEHISECHPSIKDSGARREFETGAVRDIQEGKGRCDLLPLDVLADYYVWLNPDVVCEASLVLDLIHTFVKTSDTKYLHMALEKSKIFDNNATMFLEVSKHFEEGAKKYGEYNWQKGIPTHCYIDSAVRHYLKYLRCDEDERHDRAFVWNILCCIWTCKHKPKLNDYGKRRVSNELVD